MEGQHDLPSKFRETEASPYPKVIGHFRIEQKCYVVLSVGLSSENSHPAKMTHLRELAKESEGNRFEINGHSCIILETDPTHRHDLSANPIQADDLTVLSDRELQIAQLVALGHSNKQIAQQLSISKWTVLTHLRRIFAKLGVDSRAAMVYQCVARTYSSPLHSIHPK